MRFVCVNLVDTMPTVDLHTPLFAGYDCCAGAYDELFEAPGRPRDAVARAVVAIDAIGATELRSRQRIAQNALLAGGITFSVYSNRRGTERIFPFDVIPRIISDAAWQTVERGLIQRVKALNCFLDDIYGAQRIIRDKRIPLEVVQSSAGYRAAMQGVHPCGGVRVQIAGIDLIRGPSGDFVVLEDNVRTPSGVSYVLENRAVAKRVLAPVLSRVAVRSVDTYGTRLRAALASLAPPAADSPRIVVLTPGPLNAAYFEHSFLARRMGCDLVHPSDLFVDQQRVYVKTTAGPRPVHVIYRRIDDDFLDPTVFRKDSLLGVPGLVEAYAKGHVTLANAIGNGIADDKAIYPFVPEMIRFYLSESPILDQVETLVCAREADRKRVVAAIDKMVVKQVNGSGGYGMLMGPRASRDERAAYVEQIKANPRNYIAQPLFELSTCPTWTDGQLVPRRVDLRPFVISGTSTWVLPGGLTRVALQAGSYVVNSSQGGGSKDTWVLAGTS